MSNVKPFEDEVLRAPRAALRNFLDSLQDNRASVALDVLEAVACRFGGIALKDYRSSFEESYAISIKAAIDAGARIAQALENIPIHPALALSALARPDLSQAHQRQTGAYYTDFRLAEFVAAQAADRLTPGCRIVDPACGSGILLAAASLVVRNTTPKRIGRWLAESVYAFDISPSALRGARLALTALTRDVSNLKAMAANWKCQDSLLDVSSGMHVKAFDVVVANPPWEKIKVTRHEFLRANGHARHYGDDYHAGLDEKILKGQRLKTTAYTQELTSRYSLLGSGEVDLYKAFVELFMRLVRPGGQISVLVPAGLIRSQGTQQLREFLISESDQLSVTILENRARFFGIDSRFKFLSLNCTKANGDRSAHQSLFVRHASGTPKGVAVTGEANLLKDELSRLRSDLTVPEVRSQAEWALFQRFSRNGVQWDDQPFGWDAEIVREVDMTRDRKKFLSREKPGAMPLLEGRMIHQFRCGAKAYVHGTGRRARWQPLSFGTSKVSPQFWIENDAISASVARRVGRVRAGFCDITGQTNERSMLAALIPAGVACGNKVPTITFPDDPSLTRLHLWLAIANSLTFDWILRRLVTTTVNYFLLRSVPLPRIDPASSDGAGLASRVKQLIKLDSGRRNNALWRAASLRAEIDVELLKAYGGGVADLALILEDFPLLDRGQPPIPGEKRSTITRDFLRLHAYQAFGEPVGDLEERLKDARRVGAVPYIPAEFALADPAEVSNA